MFDLILKGGIVIDGTGHDRKRADVGVTRGLIAAVGDLTGRRAERVEDVTGLFVLPGFVDLLNHSDGYLSLFSHPGCESLIRQGITTAIGGNCGSSLAPLGSGVVSKVVRKWSSFFEDDIQMMPSSSFEHFLGVRKWSDLEGVSLDWFTMAEFLRTLSRSDFAMNFGTFVGFGTLRRIVVGDESRPATKDEQELMVQNLREALREGAVGLSMGLNFSHELSETRDTLVALATVVQEEGKVVSVHLRDERDGLSDSIDEALAIAKDSGASFLISHLKPVGTRAAEEYVHVLKRLTKAQENGIDVNMTVYPYPVSYSVLYQYVPSWLHEGGREVMLSRLKESSKREKAIQEMETSSTWFAALVIARGMRMQSNTVGRTIGDIAADRGVSPAEAVLQVLEANSGFVVCFDPSISSELVDETLQHHLALVASEGAAYREEDATTAGHLAHPRSFGAFPRFFANVVRDQGLLSWEEGVQKCCSLPALKLGLHDRGFVARSLRADLVVVNPKSLQDRATLHNPFLYPSGIEHVLVNGEFVVDSGEITQNRPGSVVSL